MESRKHHGGAAAAFVRTAAVSGNTGEYVLPPDAVSIRSLTSRERLSSVHSRSTEIMSDFVVPGLKDQDRGEESTSDDASLDEEGDSLDDDECRSEESRSTSSSVDFIAPDWEMEDSECEAVDDDYEDGSDTDEEDGGHDGGHNDDVN
ncbi:hypothetical protein NLG97_g340 [Lecanicillium saksenae]|uniref:Uncharacterized protein n=1 Tax=Lecanicillium saksenae TaxID=468837 RepID=A0ACC1R888_9HYPO|nr:hypothetical protein NLG97_g340 [Lecanicillium saksenae]